MKPICAVAGGSTRPDGMSSVQVFVAGSKRKRSLKSTARPSSRDKGSRHVSQDPLPELAAQNTCLLTDGNEAIVCAHLPQPNQTTSHSPTPSTRFFFSCQCAFISFSCQCSRSRADAKHTASHPNDSCSPQTNRPNYQISTSLRATRTSAPAAARSPGGLSTSGRRPQGPGCIP